VLPRRAKKSGSGSALLSERTTTEDATPSIPYNAPHIASNGVAEPTETYTATPTANALQGTIETLIEESRKAMEEAAKSLDFVAAAKHRDRMRELQKLATESKK
jgi:excinuclease ABC subunit B